MDNATNFGEKKPNSAGLADDDDSGEYNGRVSHNALKIGDAGVADDHDAGVYCAYHRGFFCDSGDENNVGELNTDNAGVADDDDDTRVYHRGGFPGSMATKIMLTSLISKMLECFITGQLEMSVNLPECTVRGFPRFR